MSHRRYPVSLAAVFALLLVALASHASAQPIQPPSLPRTTWLNISTFRFHENTSLSNRDSFVLKGSFNAEPYSLESTDDVTLSMGGKAIIFAHDLWRKVGRNACKARTGGVSAQITYWVGGSSRCNFTFIGSRQNMPGYMASPYDTTIELRIGGAFDESVTVMVTVQNPGRGTVFNARLDSYSEDMLATFALDSVRITRSRKAGHDRMTISGRCWNSGFDPEKSAFAVNVGSFRATIEPWQQMTVVKGKGHCTLSLPTGGKVTLNFDLNTGKTSFAFTNVDLGSLANPDVLFVGVINEDSAPAWNFGLTFKENKSHTSSAY